MEGLFGTGKGLFAFVPGINKVNCLLCLSMLSVACKVSYRLFNFAQLSKLKCMF